MKNAELIWKQIWAQKHELKSQNTMYNNKSSADYL